MKKKLCRMRGKGRGKERRNYEGGEVEKGLERINYEEGEVREGKKER